MPHCLQWGGMASLLGGLGDRFPQPNRYLPSKNPAACCGDLYFLCDWIQGQPCPTAESLEVAWLQREDMVSRITLPVLRDRVKDLLAFQGSPIYRAYAFDPSDPGGGYMVHAERGI